LEGPIPAYRLRSSDPISDLRAIPVESIRDCGLKLPALDNGDFSI
jgi:hypothetical protein